LERVGEHLLGKSAVLADRKDLDVQYVELAVVRLPGRQIRRSDGGEVCPIELKTDISLFETVCRMATRYLLMRALVTVTHVSGSSGVTS
jgi:hypothetical protein